MTALAIRDEKQYLATISEVRTLVERCEHVSDAKDLADKARAAEVWAERARIGAEKVNLAAAARLWAERRAGELLAEGGERRGGRSESKSRGGTSNPLPANITKQQAHRYQKLADIPADEFGQMMEDVIPTGRITETEILRKHNAKKRVEKNLKGMHEGILASSSNAQGERWKLFFGDFRERLNDIPAESIDLICTDPPYPKEFLGYWTDLALHASRVLRRGGVLLARCGHLYLPEVLGMLSGSLQYGWLYVEPLPGSNVRFQGRKIAVAYQPWVAFSNGAWPSGQLEWHPDLLGESPRTKARYVWEQKWTVAAELIQTHALPGATVLDPFAGSGSYGEAALAVGCNWIGIESDPAGHAQAAERLQGLE